MTPRPTAPSSLEPRSGLMLVSAAPDQIHSEPFERRPFDGPRPLARPSDRLEPWLLESEPSLIAFSDAAYQRGLPCQIAASVVLERRRVGDVLACDAVATVVADLDARAQDSTVDCELSDGLAAYVRVLSRRARARDLE